MEQYDLYNLIEMRKAVLETKESSKQKEIADKLDELILAELNKATAQETA